MQRSLLRSVVVIFCVLGSTCTLSGQSSFVRGDCNRDGANDIADAIALLGFLFGGGGTPLACESACDGNDDGGVDIADAIAVLGSLFGSPVAPLTAPTTCGPDPTPDSLSCLDFPACAPVGTGLTEVRNAPDGTVDLFVAGVRVTVLRPPLGGFPGSFYVQEGPTGPAVWIAVDPLSLTPSPQPGDIVNLRVLELDTGAAGGRLVTQVGDWAVTGTADPDEYIQDVTLADDLVTNQTGYASELVVSTITVTGLFTTFGAFRGAPIESPGDMSGNLLLFLPQAVSDALGLLPGDEVLVRGVVLEAPNLSTTAIAVFDSVDVVFSESSLGEARMTPDGPTNLFISDVLLTSLYSDSSSVPGFCVQEGPTGPALSIEADPQGFNPPLQTGDAISFRITEMGTNGNSRVARDITDVSVVTTGNDTSLYLQDVSLASDLVSNQGSYGAEFVTAVVTPTAGFIPLGGWQRAFIVTEGHQQVEELMLVLPESIYQSLALLPFEPISVRGVVLDNSTAVTGIGVFDASNVEFLPPEVVSAQQGAAQDTVSVTFSTAIDPASVVDPASQFAFDPPLTVLGSTVGGSVVGLTTGPLVPSVTYTVTVAETVTAIYGGLGVSPSANSAMFTYVPPQVCAPTTTDLVINEIEYDNVGADDAEFVEIYNPTGVPQPLECVSLVFANGNAPFPTEYLSVDLSSAGSTLGPGEFLLVKAPALAAPSGVLSVDLPSASSNIQNVGPDTVSIVVDCWLLDTVSYAGEVVEADVVGCSFLPVGIYGFTLLEDTGPEVLVRFPDGANTDVNAADWSLSSTPTPGLPNVP